MMFKTTLLAATTLVSVVFTKQPNTPDPYAAPLRDLKFGQLNFLHTTDTHGWHAGHLLEPSFGADWGDYIDFAGRLREKLEADGKDLLVIDTGDRVEGNGLYDASEPKGKYTFDIFKEQHIDIICSGNHELYKQNSSENEYRITVPAFKDNYIASNLDIRDPGSGELVPLAPRYKNFTTKVQGLRVIAFGFLYDFTNNANNTVVTPVEEVVKQDWFKQVVQDKNVDLFIVIGHAAVRSMEFDLVFKEIRKMQWDTPIQFFGGHFHIRDYKKFDSTSYGLASGRFMETIGFQSISGFVQKKAQPDFGNSFSFFRRYVDNNLFSFYYHSGHNESTFHTDHGRNVSEMIYRSRKELRLDQTFGCAPKDLWMSRSQYPSANNIFSWLEERVLPEAVNDTTRSNIPRLILLNTGAIRFDIFKGAFTRDSTYIVSPFTSANHYIRDVPYEKAKKVLQLLNTGGEIFEEADPNLALEVLAPPGQLGSLETVQAQKHRTTHSEQQQMGHTTDSDLKPGYTTKDDAGNDGDDTVHSPVSFYRVPNCIQSIVSPHSQNLENENVDLVFNEFIQAYVLLALRFLGLEYSDHDVHEYMDGVAFTEVLADWISKNWPSRC
jgi:2',3'-cyclic-nucleotide 2'-phosphodiesterase (5'-nucleotidase family)